MANALNHTNIPTIFHSKGSKTLPTPLTGSALHEPLTILRRIRRARRKKRKLLKAQKMDCFSEKQGKGDEEEEKDDDDDDEKAEVKRKIVALQRIVPGGEALEVDKLFEETASYILALQCQIEAMRVLTSFIESLDKQKTKLGG